MLTKVDDRPFTQLVWEFKRQLMAYAVSLCWNKHWAEDLVHTAMLKAIRAEHTFERGTNLEAWLFTILRNVFLSEKRKRKREVEDPDDEMASRLSVGERQEWHLVGLDISRAIKQLTPAHQDVVHLLLVEGKSYQETAKLLKVATGTVKSRVFRARMILMERLGVHEHRAVCPQWLLEAFEDARTDLRIPEWHIWNLHGIPRRP